ncbi:class I SAM-dependent methyltransferase [Clostridium akagii]|uniref:class I SAM-dependent methyltransferase n=1 Tax=Clostridium akagii TaxID=91623 RepID=UPI00047B6EE0|nr:class I SAM-dependent methyltransferase [Clostridium akagii]
MEVEEVVDFNKKHMNKVTNIFQAIMGEHFHWGYFKPGICELHLAQSRLIDELVKISKIDKEKSVLDVGCGVGGTVKYMCKKYGCTAMGISNSKVGMDEATKGLNDDNQLKNVSFKVEDALDNNLPDNSFDVLIMIEAAYMIPNKEKLFAENYRVLKKGGIMLICDNMSLRKMTIKEMIKHNEGIIALKKIFGQGQYITLNEYIDIANKIGFSNVEVIKLGDQVYQTINYVINNIINNYDNLVCELGKENVDNFMEAWKTTKILCDEGISSYGVIKAIKK